jgi:hypothetical protein
MAKAFTTFTTHELRAFNMMTIGEAMQRCEINNVSIRRVDKASTVWVVTLKEWSANQCQKFRYMTDDLEDAVLNGGFLRSMANQKPLIFT